MENKEKKKLENYLEKLKSSQGESWKKIVDINKEEFNQIKMKIKEKQEGLSNLVKRKKALTISNEKFEEQSRKIQQELYELESKILKLRLQGNK